MSSVRATGLTFAPEAGTQRMRDVINKNVTEEDITRAPREKIFSRGWSRMKLLLHDRPADRDRRGRRRHRADRRAPQAHRQASLRRDADVTVSVSIARAQAAHAVPVVRDGLDRRHRAQAAPAARRRPQGARRPQVSRRRHLLRRGHLLARRSPARRRASRRPGARARASTAGTISFDCERWQRGARRVPASTRRLTSARAPSTRGLPWDHIDIGLEDGFFASASIARRSRIASARPAASPTARCCTTPTSRTPRPSRASWSASTAASPATYRRCGKSGSSTLRKLDAHRPAGRARTAPFAGSRRHTHDAADAAPQPFAQNEGTRWRLRSASSGAAAFISHLDTMRLLIRVFRRARV